jgi:hypothetical protein
MASAFVATTAADRNESRRAFSQASDTSVRGTHASKVAKRGAASVRWCRLAYNNYFVTTNCRLLLSVPDGTENG